MLRFLTRTITRALARTHIHTTRLIGQFRRPAPEAILTEREENVQGQGGGDKKGKKTRVRAYAMYYDLGVYGIPRCVCTSTNAVLTLPLPLPVPTADTDAFVQCIGYYC